jgi:asparagine synthase (glutamine-hydrolysing)
MSVQFGRWSFGGKPLAADRRKRISAKLAACGPDGDYFWSDKGIDILYRPFHTTKESRLEIQPCLLASGPILTWDGRLDNRSDLLLQLRPALPADSSDVAIVAAAYEHWGADCFASLIGDWALSLWDARERSLILAKDPLGLRHLYYALDDTQVTWSTLLDPILLLAEDNFSLCEEFVAGWLSHFPAAHLTPYAGVLSVPPSCSVLIREGKITVDRYWDFDPAKGVRYSKQAQYEDHFRTYLAQSIRRRLRSDSPVLAQLSGGIDSSSIVCLADLVMARGNAEAPGLHTVSYYDDSEPNWNERPYFMKVEEKRGRRGCHIDLTSKHSFRLSHEDFEVLPGTLRRSMAANEQFRALVVSQGHRVLLSGEGGDEVTGGVPTAIPELSDLLANIRLRALARSLKLWAIQQGRPWFHLLWESARVFLPQSLARGSREIQLARWLHPEFVRRHSAALAGYPARCRFFGARPSFQENLATLGALRGHLACCVTAADPPLERRYPFLDRDFLQFLFAVPPELLQRPGRRRALMRDALAGIVPDEILNRKRKAFVVRSPTLAVSELCPELTNEPRNLLTAEFGIVAPDIFSQTLRQAKCGFEVPIVLLLRTVEIELWLQNACARHRLISPTLTRARDFASQPKVSLRRKNEVPA